MTLRQYSPVKVVASWTTPGGTVDCADGTVRNEEFMAAARDNPTWTIENDGSGNATRVKNSNKSGSISITFSASSPTNSKLTKLAQLDEQLENIVGVLEVRDLNGDTSITMRGAFLETIPPPSFGAQRGTRTWRWVCKAQDNVAGGHDPA